MNLYPATAFIRHLLTSRSAAGHGVHSPFVFDFMTNVVRGKSDTHVICEVERLRREMLAERRTIRVTDLGAGSIRGSGQERRIQEIAATAALPGRQAALLSRIAASIRSVSLRAASPVSEHGEADRQLDGMGVAPQTTKSVTQSTEADWWQALQKPAMESTALPKESQDSGIILELGTSLGISTLALALAAPERRVVTIEGCPELAGIARENLLRHGALNVEVINMEFSDALDLLKREGGDISLAFIDGNHRGESLKQYALSIMALGEEVIIVADDIHMNRDMYSAWSSLATPGTGMRASRAKSTKTVGLPPAPPGLATATLETFRFGILFCLRSLTPGHYRIRY